MNELAKRAELGGDVEVLRQQMLVEGARRRDWQMIDHALTLGAAVANDPARFKSVILGFFGQWAEQWYEEDVRWIAQELANNVECGHYRDYDEFRKDASSYMGGWTEDLAWQALVMVNGDRWGTDLEDDILWPDVEHRLAAQGLSDIQQTIDAAHDRLRQELEEEILEYVEVGTRYTFRLGAPIVGHNALVIEGEVLEVHGTTIAVRKTTGGDVVFDWESIVAYDEVE